MTKPAQATKASQAKTNNNNKTRVPHQKLMTPEEYLHYLLSRV